MSVSEQKSPETRFQAVRYAADGHGGEQDPGDPRLSDGAVLASGTLAECREAIAKVLLVSLYARREEYAPGETGPILLREVRWTPPSWWGWDVGEEVVEAYHDRLPDDPEADGCGGWLICRIAGG